jgi:hypothetical protein
MGCSLGDLEVKIARVHTGIERRRITLKVNPNPFYFIFRSLSINYDLALNVEKGKTLGVLLSLKVIFHFYLLINARC